MGYTKTRFEHFWVPKGAQNVLFKELQIPTELPPRPALVLVQQVPLGQRVMRALLWLPAPGPAALRVLEATV